jgi:hypothetical protein
MSRPGIDRSIDPPAGWRRPAGLAVMASAALLLGGLVYLIDRPASLVAMIARTDAFAGRPVFGTLGQWLPSFVHPFGFSLLTAAALPTRATPRYGVCMAWGAVNLLFEIGQHAAMRQALADALHRALGHTPAVRWLADYFLRGSFDVGDMLAAALGAAAAAALLHFVRPSQEQTDAR